MPVYWDAMLLLNIANIKRYTTSNKNSKNCLQIVKLLQNKSNNVRKAHQSLKSILQDTLTRTVKGILYDADSIFTTNGKSTK